MEPVDFLAPLAAVLLGNGMTFALGYFLWRLKRDERDWRAMLGALAIFIAAAGVALSLPR